jgi:predicted outer membrane repeat protein
MRRLIALAVIALVFTASQAPCRTWYISPDGNGSVPNIRAGIIAASPGDTLLLADGTYSGIENTELSFAGKALVLTSESGDPHSCIVNIQGDELLWRRGFQFFNGEGPETVLDGITIMNGYGYEGSAIWCWGASPTITNVILRRNTAVLNGGAVYCGGGCNPTIRNATFVGNTAGTGAAVYAVSSSHPVLEKTIIAFNKAGGAIGVGDSGSSMSIYCSDIYGNIGGDWTGMVANQNGFSGNISMDPIFCLDENPATPYTLDASTPCAPACPPGEDFMGAAPIACGEVIAPMEAVIDLTPDVINLSSKGRFITCYIELPFGYEPEDIDETSVLLCDSIPALDDPVDVGDYDEDGIGDLMVIFLRSEVIGLIGEGYDAELEVTGLVMDEPFAGSDLIRVIQQVPRRLNQKDATAKDVAYLDTSGGEQVSSGNVLIEFNVPVQSLVRIGVYDIRGRLVDTVLNEPRVAGQHSLVWNGRDTAGGRLAPGFYFVVLDADDVKLIERVLIVR